MKKISRLTCFLIFAISCSGICQTPTTSIPPDSSIYIEPNNGFEICLKAAFRVKGVPLSIVNDKKKADFIMTTKVERGDKPSWSQTIFQGKTEATEDAAAQIINLKTTSIIWAYSVHKNNAAKGPQSTAESIAKHLAGYVKKSGKLKQGMK
jgi:hypothetical protein